MQQLLRFTQVLFTHMAQSSACNRHHALEPQLWRFLLQHIDRQAGERVLDRHGLEAHSRECYGVVQRAYEQLRSDSPIWPSQLPRANRHPGPEPPDGISVGARPRPSPGAPFLIWAVAYIALASDCRYSGR